QPALPQWRQLRRRPPAAGPAGRVERGRKSPLLDRDAAVRSARAAPAPGVAGLRRDAPQGLASRGGPPYTSRPLTRVDPFDDGFPRLINVVLGCLPIGNRYAHGGSLEIKEPLTPGLSENG